MITFFTSTRPFVGEFAEIQREAVESWAIAVPGAQIVVVGPEVATNKQGIVLVSDVWRIGIEYAKHEWICALNSDNVVFSDIGTAVVALERVRRPFVVGQRWNMPNDGSGNVELNPTIGGMDWFLFRRDTVPARQIPPFTVGQGRYDRWLLWAALEKWGMTVIDATKDVTVVHLDHGKAIGPECQANAELFQVSGAKVCNVSHAPFVLEDGLVTRRRTK